MTILDSKKKVGKLSKGGDARFLLWGQSPLGVRDLAEALDTGAVARHARSGFARHRPLPRAAEWPPGGAQGAPPAGRLCESLRPDDAQPHDGIPDHRPPQRGRAALGDRHRHFQQGAVARPADVAGIDEVGLGREAAIVGAARRRQPDAPHGVPPPAIP